MKIHLLIGIVFISFFFTCDSKSTDRFIFFLHNRFLETHQLNDLHPEYGKTEYKAIINAFEKSGFRVLSDIRNGNVNARNYATIIVNQIDSLIETGIDTKHISIIGTSKGGYIAQYVSTLANNPELNFVFIGSFRNEDIQNIPEINFCGQILNIYEKTDPFGVSAIERKNNSTCNIKNYKDLELNTGLGHGFLFQPLKEWIKPSIEWAHGNYDN